MRAAIKKLVAFHPHLGQFVDGAFTTTVRCMNFTRTVQEVLRLGYGTSALAELIPDYRHMVVGFGHAPLAHPVILVVDNDSGAKNVFNVVKHNYGVQISHTSTELFYHLCANLYLVKTPGNGAGSQSRIEDLFHPDLLKITIGGKTFDPDKKHGEEGKYGKAVFAEKVVKPKVDEIDFSGFKPMLERIMAVLQDYPERMSRSTVA